MRVSAFLLVLLLAVARAQDTVNTVCNNVINSLDCGIFANKPICASNGVQYNTECDFAKAHCLDANLKVVNEETCTGGTVAPVQTTAEPSETVTPAVTTVTVTPAVTTVTDGMVTVTIPPDVTQQPMTSNNVMTTTDPYLTPICNAVVNTVCGDDDNKLCATDGNTYQNYCRFSQARCYLPDLSIAYSGTCSSTDVFSTFTTPVRSTPPPSVFDIICRALEQVACADDGVQVCASNGVTYITACHYEKAKCQDPSLTTRDC